MPGIILNCHTSLCGLYRNVGYQAVGIIAQKRIDRGRSGHDVLGQQSVHRQCNGVGLTAVAGTYVKLPHEIDDLVLNNLLHDVEVNEIWLRFRNGFFDRSLLWSSVSRAGNRFWRYGYCVCNRAWTGNRDGFRRSIRSRLRKCKGIFGRFR